MERPSAALGSLRQGTQLGNFCSIPPDGGALVDPPLNPIIIIIIIIIIMHFQSMWERDPTAGSLYVSVSGAILQDRFFWRSCQFDCHRSSRIDSFGDGWIGSMSGRSCRIDFQRSYRITSLGGPAESVVGDPAGSARGRDPAGSPPTLASSLA